MDRICLRSPLRQRRVEPPLIEPLTNPSFALFDAAHLKEHRPLAGKAPREGIPEREVIRIVALQALEGDSDLLVGAQRLLRGAV